MYVPQRVVLLSVPWYVLGLLGLLQNTPSGSLLGPSEDLGYVHVINACMLTVHDMFEGESSNVTNSEVLDGEEDSSVDSIITNTSDQDIVIPSTPDRVEIKRLQSKIIGN
jgi:hypothetical protein